MEEKSEKEKGLLNSTETRTVQPKGRTSAGNTRLIIGAVVVLAVIVLIVIVAVILVLVRGGASVPELKIYPDESSLINFRQGDPDSYSKYTDSLHTELEKYENEHQEGESVMDCYGMTKNTDPNKVCRFPLEYLGQSCAWEREYGYDEGMPCVVLKMKKMKDWVPIPYNDSNPPPENAGLKDRWSNTSIAVTCEGQYPVDKEMIGPIKYYPENGFPVIYFPYLDQDNYKAPLVAIQFERPRYGVVIQIVCKILAQNIDHEKGGTVKFEMMID